MLGFYLHIPFCDKKCTYCDFYSIESTGLIDRFVGTLLTEIDLLPTDERPLTSIFFGGGTPSLLQPAQIRQILDRIQQKYELDSGCEITMESNPGTVTQASLEGYRAAGVNRLSVGVQSFVAEELSFLTRIHSATDAQVAINHARSAGFDNINLDLMFALPGQTLESLTVSLNHALDLQTDHISAYSLIFEPGTPLHAQLLKGAVAPQAEEVDAEMYALVMERLAHGGYEQYEVSNYARVSSRNLQCVHNLTYWHGHDYLAAGPSAHALHRGVRSWNHRSLTAWTEKITAGHLGHANTEVLTPEQRRTELAFTTLRADGLPVDRFQAEFGVDVRVALQPHLGYWISDGVVEDRGTVLRLTRKGYQLCDPITLTVLDSL